MFLLKRTAETEIKLIYLNKVKVESGHVLGYLLLCSQTFWSQEIVLHIISCKTHNGHFHSFFVQNKQTWSTCVNIWASGWTGGDYYWVYHHFYCHLKIVFTEVWLCLPHTPQKYSRSKVTCWKCILLPSLEKLMFCPNVTIAWMWR